MRVSVISINGIPYNNDQVRMRVRVDVGGWGKSLTIFGWEDDGHLALGNEDHSVRTEMILAETAPGGLDEEDNFHASVIREMIAWSRDESFVAHLLMRVI